jgi:hypothetical protein
MPLASPQAATGAGRAAEGRPTLTGLTTPQLCALWRKSRAGLRSATTPDALGQVVTARELLLDELVRREPEAMAEWLGAGAVEPEGPSDYLLREARPGR